MFLLTSGQQILRVMEETLRVQTHLRSIMEVAFDGTAWSPPAEQYENLWETYADIERNCDPAKLPRSEEPLSIRLQRKRPPGTVAG